MRFDQALQQVHDGSMSFADFAHSTRGNWRNMAMTIRRRWRCPVWHSLEDVEQDLLLGAWGCIWDFDPTRGVTLTRYVVYNAIDRAKKKAHKARGAGHSGRGSDFNPSRFELPFASLERGAPGTDDVEERLFSRSALPPAQLDHLAFKEGVARALSACDSLREWYTVQALAETGSVVAGALRLYADPEIRLDCRFSCERHAVKVVEGAAQRLAQKLKGAVT